MTGFAITERTELIALQKALLEVKFNLHPTNRELRGSPIIADLANRLADYLGSLAAAEGRSPDPALRRIDPSSREWMIATLIARETGAWWDDMDDVGRRDYARILLSPYTADDDLLNQFCKGVAPAHWRAGH